MELIHFGAIQTSNSLREMKYLWAQFQSALKCRTLHIQCTAFTMVCSFNEMAFTIQWLVLMRKTRFDVDVDVTLIELVFGHGFAMAVACFVMPFNDIVGRWLHAGSFAGCVNNFFGDIWT